MNHYDAALNVNIEIQNIKEDQRALRFIILQIKVVVIC